MPAKVTLDVVAGAMAGKKFEFEEHDTFLFGRSEDCQACLPKDQKVSRHHFILEVNPPDACLRDLGSRNGTYVNDTKHGGREKAETPEEAAKRRYPEVNLKDSDRLRVGDTVLQVKIEVPKFCCECGKDLAGIAPEGCAGPSGMYLCPACKGKLVAAAKAPAKPEPARCGKCGRDVSGEVGPHRRGQYVCISCRVDLQGLIAHFLKRAKSGDKELVAIRGYTILKELGRGGMGAVFLARHDQSGEQTALKIMLPKVAADARAKSKFLREVEISKALKHHNVVELRDFGCSEGTFFFTMEFCEGGSVDKLMTASRGRLEIAEAGKIILDVLEGLEYAHHAPIRVKLADSTEETANGVVHRDLSPQNIFISSLKNARVAKVADYGLAKAFETAGLSGGTRTGEAAGKPWFMPRQQVINFKYSKPDVDVWAAAASLYNMLTGGFPRDFPRGRDPFQVVLDPNTHAVPIRKRNSAIPPRLAEVIDHALIDKPEIPFKTAAELKRALEGIL